MTTGGETQARGSSPAMTHWGGDFVRGRTFTGNFVAAMEPEAAIAVIPAGPATAEGVMLRRLLAGLALILVAGCGTFRTAPDAVPAAAEAAMPLDHYVVFFAPRTAQLAIDAQEIVREAAAAAKLRKASKIEIAVPPAVPGGTDVVEDRYTAIQNIISASGADPGLYRHVVLSSDAMALPGGVDRAEIRLIQ